MAGKPQTLATTSAFEILGPVMVGPSSSHTAGALRCAQVAASLLEGRITKVTFGLWNSFAHTYRGHGTDRALVAGILGLDTDDENIKQAFDLAREQGLEYHFDIKGDDASIHPNTVDIDMVDDTGATAQVRGESLGGGKMRISRINGVGVDISGMYSTLFVAHQDVPGVLAALTNLRSVGVMGDERTYDYAIALRAVETQDFMTADFSRLPWELLDTVSRRIVNEVKGVNRILYDVTSKPPATVELE